jgi:NAD(P)-dependent dehydrogenase (short-subunit alcohol dehydrogenase family)
MREKTVLITGCSQGGIGASLVKAFHSRGYHVFATLRDKSKADPFFLQSDDISVVDLEITSAESIKACVDYVADRTGGKLDVLVNNAGMGLCGPLLDTDIDEAKKVYDLNVWGVLAVTQAFAPMLVKAKGAVCNISSVAACFTFAWSGMSSPPYPFPMVKC